MKRRRFLQTMLGGATVVAVVSKGRSAEEDKAVGSSRPVRNGYRETEHIRLYYQKARL
ncbi:MAG TPA: formate dehydrogenase [Methylothermaceae bacterium]|nr:formate dehydrogenase [Methylothermaceae bacterium]